MRAIVAKMREEKVRVKEERLVELRSVKALNVAGSKADFKVVLCISFGSFTSYARSLYNIHD